MKMYILEYNFAKDGKLPYVDVTEKSIVKYSFKKKPSKYTRNKWVFELANGTKIYEGSLDQVSNYRSYTMEKSKVKQISKDMIKIRIESFKATIMNQNIETELHKKALEELK